MTLNKENSTKKNLTTQFNFAILLLWLGGLGALAFFVTYNTSINQSIVVNEKIEKLDSIKKISNQKSTENDAYVFINVNKKHFLTRFVGSVNNEIDDSLGKPQKITSPNQQRSVVEKVAKKITLPKGKKNTDFTIKKVPQ